MGDLPGRRLRHRAAAGRAAGRRRPAPRRPARAQPRARHELVPAPRRVGGDARRRRPGELAAHPRRRRRDPRRARPEPRRRQPRHARQAGRHRRAAGADRPRRAAAGDGERRRRWASRTSRSTSTRSACRCWSRSRTSRTGPLTAPRGPYRIAPNMMVVVPTSNDVRLTFDRSTSDLFFYALTGLGILLLIASRIWGDKLLAGFDRRPPRRTCVRRRGRRAGRPAWRRSPWPEPESGPSSWAPPDLTPPRGGCATTTDRRAPQRFVMWMTIRRPMPEARDGPAEQPTNLTGRHVCARRDRQGLRRPRDGPRPAERDRRPRAWAWRSPATPAPPSCSSAATCARPGRRSSPRSPTVCAARASTWSTSGWRRRTWCTSPPATSTARAPSSPPRTTRPSTTASSSASRAPGRWASTGSARSRPWPARCSTATARADAAAPGRVASRTCCRRSSSTSSRSSTRQRSARCAWSPTPPTGWAASSCRPCSNGSRRSSSR